MVEVLADPEVVAGRDGPAFASTGQARQLLGHCRWEVPDLRGEGIAYAGEAHRLVDQSGCGRARLLLGPGGPGDRLSGQANARGTGDQLPELLLGHFLGALFGQRRPEGIVEPGARLDRGGSGIGRAPRAPSAQAVACTR